MQGVQILTQQLQLFAPTHRVLVASGVLEALLAQVLSLLVSIRQHTSAYVSLVASGVLEALLAQVLGLLALLVY